MLSQLKKRLTWMSRTWWETGTDIVPTQLQQLEAWLKPIDREVTSKSVHQASDFSSRPSHHLIIGALAAAGCLDWTELRRTVKILHLPSTSAGCHCCCCCWEHRAKMCPKRLRSPAFESPLILWTKCPWELSSCGGICSSETSHHVEKSPSAPVESLSLSLLDWSSSLLKQSLGENSWGQVKGSHQWPQVDKGGA